MLCVQELYKFQWKQFTRGGSYNYLNIFLHSSHTILPSNSNVNATSLVPQRIEMEDPTVSTFSKPKKRNIFPRRSWLVVILKKQLAVEVFPKGKNLSPKRNQLAILKRQVTGVCPRKRGPFLPRKSQSAVELKKLLAARAAAPRKNSRHYTRKIRMDISLVGCFPSQHISYASIKTNS